MADVDTYMQIPVAELDGLDDWIGRAGSDGPKLSHHASSQLFELLAHLSSNQVAELHRKQLSVALHESKSKPDTHNPGHDSLSYHQADSTPVSMQEDSNDELSHMSTCSEPHRVTSQIQTPVSPPSERQSEQPAPKSKSAPPANKLGPRKSTAKRNTRNADEDPEVAAQRAQAEVRAFIGRSRALSLDSYALNLGIKTPVAPSFNHRPQLAQSPSLEAWNNGCVPGGNPKTPSSVAKGGSRQKSSGGDMGMGMISPNDVSVHVANLGPAYPSPTSLGSRNVIASVTSSAQSIDSSSSSPSPNRPERHSTDPPSWYATMGKHEGQGGQSRGDSRRISSQSADINNSGLPQHQPPRRASFPTNQKQYETRESSRLGSNRTDSIANANQRPSSVLANDYDDLNVIRKRSRSEVSNIDPTAEGHAAVGMLDSRNSSRTKFRVGEGSMDSDDSDDSSDDDGMGGRREGGDFDPSMLGLGEEWQRVLHMVRWGPGRGPMDPLDTRHRQQLKRLKNREAAARCRYRRRHLIRALQNQIDDLTKANADLMKEVHRLNARLQQYENPQQPRGNRLTN